MKKSRLLTGYVAALPSFAGARGTEGFGVIPDLEWRIPE